MQGMHGYVTRRIEGDVAEAPSCYSFVAISDELESSLTSVIHRLKSLDKIPCGLKTFVVLPRVGIPTDPGRVRIDNRGNVARPRHYKL